MRKLFYILLAALSLAGLSGCYPDPPEGLFTDPSGIFPDHFSTVKLAPDQELTPTRIALGKKLFFDPILSRDSTISCGSCHFPEKAFTDGVKLSRGIDGRTALRNSPTLANIAWSTTLFWDGGVPNLELQVLAPIENPDEMDHDIAVAIRDLSQNEEYVALFEEAYGRRPDVYSLTRAIAAFQRSLVSANTPFDRWVTGEDPNALSPSAERGRQLFFGEKAECFHCHTGIQFTDFSFQNNGLYAEYPDEGRYRITSFEFDKGKFKVPSLRNIAVTAPYMHDGSLATLEDVVRHYESGGKNHPNKSPLIRPFRLTEQERDDLIAFLHTLTDTAFLQNPAFRP